jgi:hypothetical protein
MHPQPRVRFVVVVCTRVFTAEAPETSGIPAREWFYGLLRALPGDHRFVDPVIRATRWRPRELDACFGAPEPHGFTVRNEKRSSHAPSRPPHPTSRS